VRRSRSRVRGAAPGRRRDATQDLRGPRDGKGGGVHERGGGGPAARAGDALRTRGRCGAVRRRGRRTARGSRPPPRAGRRRTEPGGAAVLVVARGSRVRGPMRGGDPPCALTCSGSATSDPVRPPASRKRVKIGRASGREREGGQDG